MLQLPTDMYPQKSKTRDLSNNSNKTVKIIQTRRHNCLLSEDHSVLFMYLQK